MIDRAHPTLSVRRQCQLLDVSRASVYRRPAPVSADDLRLMELIDRQYLALLWCMEVGEYGFLSGSVIFKRRGRRPGVRGRAFG